jgi:hypothetical protein
MPKENADKCCIRVVGFVALYKGKKVKETKHISYCESAAAAAIHCCYQWARIGIRLVGCYQGLEEEGDILARRSWLVALKPCDGPSDGEYS